MNYSRVITLLALCAAISACDVPDTTMANGRITLKDNLVTLHANGAPDALIGSSGNLQIGDATVPVTPAQNGLLMLYFQNVADVHQTGADMGVKALKDSLDGKSKAEQDQHAEAGAGQLKALEQKMCQDLANVKNVQDQLAAQLPAFKPYADIMTGKDITDCQKD